MLMTVIARVGVIEVDVRVEQTVDATERTRRSQGEAVRQPGLEPCGETSVVAPGVQTAVGWTVGAAETTTHYQAGIAVDGTHATLLR
jgi:hypothetical protein